mmetsp:Transcript_24146/g.66911  ORF Transcript_24146/g.66911 Transcript_24146/m.66911 type:complete len:211 (+) Transcript_24146:762-1394(+)
MRLPFDRDPFQVANGSRKARCVVRRLSSKYRALDSSRATSDARLFWRGPSSESFRSSWMITRSEVCWELLDFSIRSSLSTAVSVASPSVLFIIPLSFWTVFWCSNREASSERISLSIDRSCSRSVRNRRTVSAVWWATSQCVARTSMNGVSSRSRSARTRAELLPGSLLLLSLRSFPPPLLLLPPTGSESILPAAADRSRWRAEAIRVGL